MPAVSARKRPWSIHGAAEVVWSAALSLVEVAVAVVVAIFGMIVTSEAGVVAALQAIAVVLKIGYMAYSGVSVDVAAVATAVACELASLSAGEDACVGFVGVVVYVVPSMPVGIAEVRDAVREGIAHLVVCAEQEIEGVVLVVVDTVARGVSVPVDVAGMVVVGFELIRVVVQVARIRVYNVPVDLHSVAVVSVVAETADVVAVAIPAVVKAEIAVEVVILFVVVVAVHAKNLDAIHRVETEVGSVREKLNAMMVTSGAL